MYLFSSFMEALGDVSINIIIAIFILLIISQTNLAVEIISNLIRAELKLKKKPLCNFLIVKHSILKKLFKAHFLLVNSKV